MCVCMCVCKYVFVFCVSVKCVCVCKCVCVRVLRKRVDKSSHRLLLTNFACYALFKMHYIDTV